MALISLKEFAEINELVKNPYTALVNGPDFIYGERQGSSIYTSSFQEGNRDYDAKIDNKQVFYRMMFRTLPRIGHQTAEERLLAMMGTIAADINGIYSGEHGIALYSRPDFNPDLHLRLISGQGIGRTDLNSIAIPRILDRSNGFYDLIAKIHTHPVRQGGVNFRPSLGDLENAISDRINILNEIPVDFIPHWYGIAALSTAVVNGEIQNANDLVDLRRNNPTAQITPHEVIVLWLRNSGYYGISSSQIGNGKLPITEIEKLLEKDASVLDKAIGRTLDPTQGQNLIYVGTTILNLLNNPSFGLRGRLDMVTLDPDSETISKVHLVHSTKDTMESDDTLIPLMPDFNY